MKIYHTQSEVEKDIKDGVLVVEGDVKFECPISINASIQIIEGNINAGNIDAWNINAGNINAGNINAGNIDAWNINAWNIDAWNIDAWNISYYAICFVYQSIKCLSIKAKRKVHQEPICLEGKLEYKKKEELNLSGKEVEVKIDGVTYKAVIK